MGTAAETPTCLDASCPKHENTALDKVQKGPEKSHGGRKMLGFLRITVCFWVSDKYDNETERAVYKGGGTR